MKSHLKYDAKLTCRVIGVSLTIHIVQECKTYLKFIIKSHYSINLAIILIFAINGVTRVVSQIKLFDTRFKLELD